MDNLTAVIAVAFALLLGILGCIELGYRIGKWARARAEEKSDASFGVAGGALLGLLGLILGFCFSGAQSRMDNRRALVVQEANAIGTSYLRLQLLRPEEQAALQPMFKRYADVRIELHQVIHDHITDKSLLTEGIRLQNQIWSTAIAACEAKQDPRVKALVLPPINEMIDITTAQAIARRTHLPAVALMLLIALAMLSGVVIGRAMAPMPKRSILISLIYAVSITMTVYVILDLELPRQGLIRVDFVEDAMKDVRAGME